jgi:hypothetical protein
VESRGQVKGLTQSSAVQASTLLFILPARISPPSGQAGDGDAVGVHSDSVGHQFVQNILDAPSEFLTAGDDFHAEIVEAFTCYFHRGVLEMVGTSHLRSQVRTTSFDSFEFGVELPAHLDLAPGSAQETSAKHQEPTRLFLQGAGKQKRRGKSRQFE